MPTDVFARLIGERVVDVVGGIIRAEFSAAPARRAGEAGPGNATAITADHAPGRPITAVASDNDGSVRKGIRLRDAGRPQ